jgi:hypothetical protein
LERNKDVSRSRAAKPVRPTRLTSLSTFDRMLRQVAIMGHRRLPFRHSRCRARIRLVCVSESTSASAGRSGTYRLRPSRQMDARPRLDRSFRQRPLRPRSTSFSATRRSEFMSVFEDHCRDKGLELRRPAAQVPPSTVASNAPQSSWRYEFYAATPARAHRQAPAPRRRFAHR